MRSNDVFQPPALTSLYNRPRLLMTLVALFWAGNFVVGRAVVGHLPPVTLACLRWALATLILLPFAWGDLKRDAPAIWRHRLLIVFFGVIGAGSYNTLSYLGLSSTEALNGLVLNAAGPMFIAAAAWALFGDRVTTGQTIGLATGFAGVLIIIAKGDLASLAGFRFNPGDALIIAASITWAVYTAYLRKRPHIGWLSFNVSTFAVAALGNAPLALVELGLGHTVEVSAASFAAIAYVAIFPSLLAYIFYNRGVELLGPARAGLYLFLIPVFGALLAVAFLGERLHPFHAAGFAFIIAGVLIGNRARKSVKAETRPAGGELVPPS
jgi:drug/metabolite transporter (DMT)-like permease